MADLYVKEFGTINPFIVASSPATQGARNVLKTAKARPGAIVLRNFGHGAGGGGYIGGGASAMYEGKAVSHSHAIGQQIKDPVRTLEQYCEEVRKVKKEMDSDIKLWVSVGHYNDIPAGGSWQKDWLNQANELELAGADAIELHFNTPGVAALGGRLFDYYALVEHCTKMIKAATKLPVMVKLAVEGCDPFRAIKAASAAGADAVGPTARWKAFCMDLDWRTTQARPGGGYGGTQATPIVCYAIAEARSAGIKTPMFAGGGVFSYDQAARIIMAGSQLAQVGSLACSGGVSAVERMIKQFEGWMDKVGYKNMDELCGDALKLYNMPGDIASERTRRLAEAYRDFQVVKEECTGCGNCYDVCWHDAIVIENKIARKQKNCIGCGYCFQVCPTKALEVDAAGILSSVF
jgi:dihydropyrimidine dehydrogenase (NAD+) subunit PreA